MGTFMSKFSKASARFTKAGETNLHNNGPVDPEKKKMLRVEKKLKKIDPKKDDAKSGPNPNINIDKKTGLATSIKTTSGGNYVPTKKFIDDAVAGTGPTFDPKNLQMDKSYVTEFGGNRVELKNIQKDKKYSKFVGDKGKVTNIPQTTTGQSRFLDSVSKRQNMVNKQKQNFLDIQKNLKDYRLAGGKGTKKVSL